MKQTPSMFRIVQIDYLASVAVIFPIAIWGLVVVAPFFDPEAATFFGRAAPPVTLVGLLVIAWRIWQIRSVFASGEEVPGVINGIRFFRGRGRVKYAYTYQGQEYESGNAIQSTAVTRALAQGQKVTLMVDPSKPERAFVSDLYL